MGDVLFVFIFNDLGNYRNQLQSKEQNVRQLMNWIELINENCALI